MKPNTPWQPAPAASVVWGEDGTPLSTDFDDVYYARENGLEESRYVFVEGNGLPLRWEGCRDEPFTIAETGFGTGLNFLLTWQAWRHLPQPRPRLHYLSIEKYPLTATDLARTAADWPELRPLSGQLLRQYPGLLPGQHRLLFEGGALTLDLWWDEVGDVLADLAGRQRPLVDAWYLDGFAPARNTAMWDTDVIQAVGRLSRARATFSTFTAAGQVRRDLEAAGFEVKKAPGFGRKRECLRGELTRPPAADASVSQTPWDLPAVAQTAPSSALVIGAGLAGCTVADALARRGITVTLLDQGGLAGAGSGNEQGILYTRLSHKHSPLTDFALQSFRFAGGFFQELFHNGALVEGCDGALCGSFNQHGDSEEMAALSKVLAGVPELARVVDAAEANRLTGIEQESGGYWLPASGWLRPGSVCRALVERAGITLREHCGPLALSTSDGQWRAMRGDQVLAEAECAFVATGTGSVSRAGLEWLPLQRIRGQTTQLPANSCLQVLRTAFCHQGYIAPAREGEHCIGATFDLGDTNDDLRVEDHRENLSRLAAAVPAWETMLDAINPDTLSGRVGFRCASPDYLPLVGPVPDRDAFLQDFANLRRNARQTIDKKGKYMPGLYLSTGHGSRGLTSTPLAAELLASAACGEPPPLDRILCRALAPARFLIRDLSRNRA